MIGGTPLHSTIEYCRYINQQVNDFDGDNMIPLLMIKEKDIQIPIFNTTKIHAQAGANFIVLNLTIGCR